MAGTSLTAHTRLVPAVRRPDTRAKTEPRPSRSSVDHERLDSTSPYPRNFEARNEGRESVPYLELEIATERQDTLETHDDHKRAPVRVVKTVSRKIGIGTGTETALQPAASKAVDPEAPTEAIAKLAARDVDPDDLKTTAIEKQSVVEDKLEPSVVDDELELSTQRVVKMLEALTPKLARLTRAETEPNGPAPRPSRLQCETEPNGPAPRPSRLQWLGVVLTQPEVGAALMIGTWLRPEFCVTSPVTHVFPRGDGILVQTTTKSRYFVGPDGDTYLVRKSG